MAATWRVRRHGVFVTYEDARIQRDVEAAYARGDESVDVCYQGEQLHIEFAAHSAHSASSEPLMRQRLADSESGWRPVQRIPPARPGHQDVAPPTTPTSLPATRPAPASNRLHRPPTAAASVHGVSVEAAAHTSHASQRACEGPVPVGAGGGNVAAVAGVRFGGVDDAEEHELQLAIALSLAEASSAAEGAAAPAAHASTAAGKARAGVPKKPAPVVVNLIDSDDETDARPMRRDRDRQQSHVGGQSADSQLRDVRQRVASDFRSASAATAASAASAAAAASPLYLLTYNLWFQRIEVARRMEQIAMLADRGPPPPALLAMQECTTALMAELTPRLLAAGYRQPFEQPYRLHGENGYGVAIATRPPLGPLEGARFLPYRGSMMMRGLVLARTRWPGVGLIAVGCTHAESFIGAEHEREVIRARRQQLGEAAAALEAEARRHGCVGAFLMGDLNWEDGKDGDALACVGPGWRDAFLEMGSPPAASRTCGFARQAWRFDRVLYTSVGAAAGAAALGESADGRSRSRVQLVPKSMTLVGQEPIPGYTFQSRAGRGRPLHPSDHRGLLVTMEVSGTDAV